MVWSKLRYVAKPTKQRSQSHKKTNEFTVLCRFVLCTAGRVECTDGGISEWTCGGGGQVVTTWSQSRPPDCGMFHTVRFLMGITMCGD